MRRYSLGLLAVLIAVAMLGLLGAVSAQRVVIRDAIIFKLTAQSDATFQGDVTVQGSETVQTNLTVQGTTTSQGNVTAQADLTVQDNATVQNDLTVQDNATVQDDFRMPAQTSITVTQSSTLTPTGSYQPITAAGTLSFGAIAAGTDGDMLIVTNTSTPTITITDTGTLKLAGNAALGQFDSLTLISDGTNWTELARSDN